MSEMIASRRSPLPRDVARDEHAAGLGPPVIEQPTGGERQRDAPPLELVVVIPRRGVDDLAAETLDAGNLRCVRL